MVKLGEGAVMLFDFVYVRADAASSFQGQDGREHPTVSPLHTCLLSFAAVVTVFAALLAFTLLFKLPTACKGELLLLLAFILVDSACYCLLPCCSCSAPLFRLYAVFI